MSAQHYYLVASLPSLSFREEPPITEEKFLEECGKWLSEKEMRDLSISKEDGAEKESLPAVGAAWREFDDSLRKDLAEARRARKDRTELKPSFWAARVMEQANPLEMELFFEKIRWDFLSSLEGGHFFDIGKLIVYYQKLDILERLSKFDKDNGEMYFNRIREVKYDYTAG
ncbi:MAG TPA: DUF2764 family protein [Candidatus Omnitrophota bacterium]|nr:DUF2764 family protein [Candidatus Omnitrophota bacterium]